MAFNIILICVLLACSALFSCSETTLFSLSRSQLKRFKGSKSPFARYVIAALSRPREVLVGILLGNELVNVAIAILVAATVYDLMVDFPWQTAVLTAVVVSTPLIVILGEVLPKNIGVRFAAQLAPILVVPLRLFTTITKPAQTILLWLANHAITLFKGDPRQVRSLIMEEEFRQIVDLSLEEGAIHRAEGELIHRMFDMADTAIDTIMTPKERIFSLPLDAGIDDAMEQIRVTQFSRIPVYLGDPDDIVGILYIRDLFPALRNQRIKKLRDLEEIVRPAYFVPHHTTVETMLSEFKKTKIHIAIVVDKAKMPIGIVTMDDIFGAILER